jgi:acetyltransferase
LTLAEFDDVRTALETLLPDGVDATNPLDVIGDADLDRFERALDVVLGAPTVGGVIVLSVPTATVAFDDLATAIGDVQSQHGKPVAACLMGGDEAERAGDTLSTYGIPNYFDPTRAVSSLEALADYEAIRNREYDSPTEFDVDRERAREILAPSIERGRNNLSVEAMDLLDAYKIPTPSGAVAATAGEAERVAQGIGGPVVMKIVSPDILHKSDIGGVEAGIPVENVRDTYHALRERATSHDPDATVLGVRVEELVDIDESTETIVGVKRDPQFGHLLMFGLGGIFVQIFEDASFRVVPVSERDARLMTTEIKAAPMLRGARGRTPADLDGVVETLQRISQLVTDFPAIKELDVNPLVVGPSGVCAVDLRVTIDATGLNGSP